MSTRAIIFLQKNKIPFEVIKYEHEEKGAEFAAQATGYPLEITVKTLVVELERKKYCLALLPGNVELNLKKLASVARVKRSAMVDTKTAERLTGYLVGGISPFATRQRLPVIIEKSILRNPEILINAGQRGKMIKISPQNLVKTIGCTVAMIAS